MRRAQSQHALAHGRRLRGNPRAWTVALGAACGLAILAGCGDYLTSANPGAPPGKPGPMKVAVLVSEPVAGEITDFEDFTGRTEAVRTVNIRARATGYLEKRLFKEGSEVEAGQTLFEIDARPYQIELERAEANLAQAEARAKRLELDYKRSLPMVATKALSPQDFDHVVSDRAEGIAAVGVARAQRELAQQNLDFCKVVSPIKGRMGRGLIDPGNMVRADDTMLANVVTQDPIYVYFDVDERTKLRLVHWAQQGRIRADLSDVPLAMALADEVDYPHRGTINFQDNQLDAATGTIRVRGVFPNKDRLLTPGLFVRVRLPVGIAYQALMVADQAIGADQERKFVYVIDAENKVVYRPVTTGRAINRRRVIEKGLAPGERVVVSGLQRVRPGAEVTPTLVEMPGTAAAAGPESAAEPTVVAGKPSSP